MTPQHTAQAKAILGPDKILAVEQKQLIAEHFDAGATHVCIQPVHPAGDLAAAKRVLEALAPG